MLRNLVLSLFTYGRITTTVDRAKEGRRLADRIITLGKKGTLAHRRRAAAVLRDDGILKKVFGDLATRFKDRAGGYTRIIRFGGSRWDGDGRGKYAELRLGDGGKRVLWELVERQEKEQEMFLAGRGKRARDERVIEKRARKEAAQKAAAK